MLTLTRTTLLPFSISRSWCVKPRIGAQRGNEADVQPLTGNRQLMNAVRSISYNGNWCVWQPAMKEEDHLPCQHAQLTTLSENVQEAHFRRSSSHLNKN